MNRKLIPERSFRLLLLLGFFWPLFLVAAYCGSLFIQGTINSGVRDELAAMQSRRWLATNIQSHLLDMETGVRGYMLGDGPFLEPYTRAQASITTELQQLLNDSRGLTVEERLAKRIQVDSGDWMATAIQMITAREKRNPPDVAMLGIGKKKFDVLRSDFSRYINIEAGEITATTAKADALKIRIAYIALFGGFLLALLLVFTSVNHLRMVSSIYHEAFISNESKAAHITEMNAALELRVAERTAELLNANQELEAFSYSVSHDLRAPLRSIASFSLILQQDLADKLDEDSADNLRRIRQASSKMTQLIDALLRFSRIARVTLTRTMVDISAMAESVLSDLHKDTGKEVEYVVQPGMVAEGDLHLLRVALENLLENAWKFSSNKDAPKIEVGFEDEAFFIRDNGAGFQSDYVHKIFLPFERLHTDQEFPGTGIGLATTKRIIDRHGGKIWAEGEVGKGATFYFTLNSDAKGNSEN